MLKSLSKKIGNYFLGNIISQLENPLDIVRAYLMLNLPLGYALITICTLPIIYLGDAFLVFWLGIFGVFINLSTLFLLRIFNSVDIVGRIFIVFNFINNTIIFVLLGSYIDFFAAPYYIIGVVCVSFLTNRKWVIGYSFATIITLSTLSIIKIYGVGLEPPTISNTQKVYSQIGNLVIVFILIYYLLSQFIKQRNIAAKRLKNSLDKVTKLYKEIAEQKEEVESQRDFIEQQRDDIMASIAYAKKIQEAILPSLKSIYSVFNDCFVLYKPKDVVAGDFYWMEKAHNKIYIAVADCTGHGVPGAFVSIVCSNALSKVVLEDNISDVGKILDKTRDLVIEKLTKSEDMVDGMDISLACISLDDMVLEWSGANNPLYLIRNTFKDTNPQVEIIRGDRQHIGFTSDSYPFTKHKVNLNKGDIFYLFSDGYADQFGGINHKKFGYRNFRSLLEEISGKPMEEQKIILESNFLNWKSNSGNNQIDDVCIIGIRI